jgi:malonate transporter and related proteins
VQSIFNTVLPVFGLIVLGYVFARVRLIDANAGRGISIFVFNIAIPALLFKTVSVIDTHESAPWSLWLVFFGGLALTWAVGAIASRFVQSLDFSGGAIASMAASFGNLAMLGTPLALSHFGEQVAVPLGLILSIHAPILWFSAVLHRELARSLSFDLKAVLIDLAKALGTNAIVLALIAASLWRLTGIGLHPIPEEMLTMLANAGIPTALFALGVSLASYSLRGAWDGVFALIVLKMVLMPVFVFAIGKVFPGLSPLWLQLAVLFAAMPTGANAFLFAQQSNEAVPAVSGAITLGTGLSAITASILLWMMDSGLI